MGFLGVAVPSAHAQVVEHVVTTVRGGLAMDAWGEISDPDTFASGELLVQIPDGATVDQAWLFTVTRSGSSVDPSLPVADPPRTVIVGSGSTAVSRNLVGTPDRPSVMSGAGYGVWVTDVTPAVADALAIDGSVPIQERGDPADPYDQFAYYVQGHVLVALYQLATAPMRHVSIFGSTGVDDFSGVLSLAGPHRPCADGDPGAEPAILSVAFASELTGCEEANVVTVGSTLVSDAAGGSDDWPSDPHVSGGTCPAGPWRRGGLITAGSFGASLTAGERDTPHGVDGDELDGTGGRVDDELYDLAIALPAGATTTTIDLDIRTSGRTRESMAMPVIALQALAAGVEGEPEYERVCNLLPSTTDGGPSAADGGSGPPDTGSSGTDGGAGSDSGLVAPDGRTPGTYSFTGSGGCACGVSAPGPTPARAFIAFLLVVCARLESRRSRRVIRGLSAGARRLPSPDR